MRPTTAELYRLVRVREVLAETEATRLDVELLVHDLPRVGDHLRVRLADGRARLVRVTAVELTGYEPEASAGALLHTPVLYVSSVRTDGPQLVVGSLVRLATRGEVDA